MVLSTEGQDELRETPRDTGEDDSLAFESSPAADDNLMALAEAESEIEAAETPNTYDDGVLKYQVVSRRAIAERRKRGNVVWGAVALGLAIQAWVLPFAAVLFFAYLRPGSAGSEVVVLELALLLGALVCGTIGCRRVEGKKMAFVGRIMAWSTPTVALVVEAGFSSHNSSVSLIVAMAALLVWAAIGFFFFAIVDAIVEP